MCEGNSPADTQVSAGGAPGAGAEIPLGQPMVRQLSPELREGTGMLRSTMRMDIEQVGA